MVLGNCLHPCGCLYPCHHHHVRKHRQVLSFASLETALVVCHVQYVAWSRDDYNLLQVKALVLLHSHEVEPGQFCAHERVVMLGQEASSFRTLKLMPRLDYFFLARQALLHRLAFLSKTPQKQKVEQICPLVVKVASFPQRSRAPRHSLFVHASLHEASL